MFDLSPPWKAEMKVADSPNSNTVRGVLLGLVKTELETYLLQAQRRFFVVDDKATQIGTSVGRLCLDKRFYLTRQDMF